MKLKSFDKNTRLKQLRRKKNKEKIIMLSTMGFSLIIFIAGLIFFAYARYEVEKKFTLMNATVGDFQSGDFVIAAYVDGNKSKSIPQKDSGYYLQKVECENGATGTWDSSSWELTVANATSQTKCYVYFTTLIAQADTTGQYSTLSKYYPVGSYYYTSENVNPSTLFGGTWERIENKFLLGASSTYTAGSTGGSADAVLVSHSHTRGTMNITASATLTAFQNDGNMSFGGAWYVTGRSTTVWNTLAFSSSYNATPYTYSFDASRTWSGSTSTEGESGVGKNMPPYLAAYIWHRTA